MYYITIKVCEWKNDRRTRSKRGWKYAKKIIFCDEISKTDTEVDKCFEKNSN